MHNEGLSSKIPRLFQIATRLQKINQTDKCKSQSSKYLVWFPQSIYGKYFFICIAVWKCLGTWDDEHCYCTLNGFSIKLIPCSASYFALKDILVCYVCLCLMAKVSLGLTCCLAWVMLSRYNFIIWVGYLRCVIKGNWSEPSCMISIFSSASPNTKISFVFLNPFCQAMYRDFTLLTSLSSCYTTAFSLSS